MGTNTQRKFVRDSIHVFVQHPSIHVPETIIEVQAKIYSIPQGSIALYHDPNKTRLICLASNATGNWVQIAEFENYEISASIELLKQHQSQ